LEGSDKTAQAINSEVTGDLKQDTKESNFIRDLATTLLSVFNRFGDFSNKELISIIFDPRKRPVKAAWI